MLAVALIDSRVAIRITCGACAIVPMFVQYRITNVFLHVVIIIMCYAVQRGAIPLCRCPKGCEMSRNQAHVWSTCVEHMCGDTVV